MASRKKKIQPNSKTNVVPIAGAPAALGVHTLPLEELYVYKLQLLTKRCEEARVAVVQPLKALYEQDLLRKVNAALSQDAGCRAANEARAACINEILEKTAGALPAGYAVSRISPEDGTVIAEFNPERAGKKLDLKT
jgi:hypothetical protein